MPMNLPLRYAVADSEYYAPLEEARDRGQVYAPPDVPDGWKLADSGVWSMWYREGLLRGVGEGWKVHVSARPGRQQAVLDTVSAICFRRETAFKHLSSHLFYWWTHHKQAARPQSGKFIAAYPTSAEAARELMEELSHALAGEEGPYILTDRRYRDSRTVHYRYGAFAPHDRLNADGTRTPLVRTSTDRYVEDRRGVAFHLPEGVTDPFRQPPARAGRAPAPGTKQAPPAARRTVSFQGFAFDASIRFSNAGGTYRGREEATGREVFIKEARAHCGVGEADSTAPEQLRAEWQNLRALHDVAPGLAPQPLAYFREWEHHYMVTEFIDGKPLNAWMAGNHPMLGVDRPRQEHEAYYARCLAILDDIERALDRLHALGYVFVDVSPGNVMVTDDGRARLIDFEAAHRLGAGPFRLIGTPGYVAPPELVGDDLRVHDDYGLAALALLLLGPFHQVVRRNRAALAHLHAELSERAPVPPELWSRATRFHPWAAPTVEAPETSREEAAAALPPDETATLPSPQEVAAEPLRHLAELRDRTGDALLAMARLDHPGRVFPTIPEGYQTNVLCLAYGTAGVVHALGRAGRELPAGLLDRLSADALAAVGTLPPGLYSGSAGIALVLADHGRLTQAGDLLDAADRHPLTTRGASATLFGGTAGIAMAHLALYGHTRDERHVDRAAELAAALPPDGELTPRLGADDATGLLHGRTGVALMLQQLAAVTGDAALLARGTRLLHAELDRAIDPQGPGLTFPLSAADPRSLPYLFAGSAGMVHAVTRQLKMVDDERLAAALPRLLSPLRTTFTVMPGLHQGLAGLGFALAGHAELTGDEDSRRDAIRVARGLFKFAVPHPTGARFLGDQLMRFSADLWSGSSGVLLFLAQLLDPRPDALFTVDALAVPATVAP
jgi:hypothetical protein